jgi:hypothetical protein
LSFNVLSCDVLSFDVLSFDVLSFDVLSFDVLSFDVLYVHHSFTFHCFRFLNSIPRAAVCVPILLQWRGAAGRASGLLEKTAVLEPLSARFKVRRGNCGGGGVVSLACWLSRGPLPLASTLAASNPRGCESSVRPAGSPVSGELVLLIFWLFLTVTGTESYESGQRYVKYSSAGCFSHTGITFL